MTNGSVHAFPHMRIEGGTVRLEGGLSKREYFAALAMQGLVSAVYSSMEMLNEFTREEGGYIRRHLTGNEAISRASVSYADALLAELEKERG